MTRRVIWLGLLLVASQFSMGCCCWRQHCAGWRLQHWRGCGTGSCAVGPTYAASHVGPAVGGCPSCYTPPGEYAQAPPPGLAYGGPAMIPGGPVPGGPPIAGPYPLTPIPSVEPQRDPGTGFPQPMPPR